MKRSFLIARSNLRRAKGQTAAIVVLILIAAFMLNLWLMLSTDYKRNFDRYHDKLNAEHVTLALADDDDRLRDFVSETLEQDGRVLQYCMDDALNMNGSFEYNGGEISTYFVIMEMQAALNRPVGRYEIVEDSEFTSGVYLPMLYATDSNIAVGETIELTIGSNTISYTVCGFFNSVMTGSHNCVMLALMLTEDKYKELEEMGFAPRSTLVSVRINDMTESEDFKATLNNAILSMYPAVRIMNNSYTEVSFSRYISQMICSGIVSTMAFLVTLIALAVITSNVMNYIQENMKNLGALKAVGYKSSQIIAALLLQFLSVTLLSAAVGIGFSYLVFPSVNNMMIAQTGIPYAIRFLPLPFVITIVFIGGVVALAVLLSSHRIKKIEPITALRGGVATHSFKKNHVPLDKTSAPLSFALALKTTLSGVKQNVTVCLTMFVLSLVVVFSGLMLKNVIVDMQPFIDLVVGEMADSLINVNTGIEDEFLRMTNEDDRVQKAYLYHLQQVNHVDGYCLVAVITDDFSNMNNQGLCFEGRFPKYENEMAISGKYARDEGLNIGDEVTLRAEGSEMKYIISGFTQMSNYLGKDCMLTRDGYERMGRLLNASYYVSMEDGADIDAFNRDVSGRFGDNVNETVNLLSAQESTGKVYVLLITIIVVVILVLSMVIIAFVLYLLVRTLLNNKKRAYGIMKAMGFTTGQLILQTAISFMPAVIFGMASGLIVSSMVIRPLVSVFLGGIGIVKCTFTVPVSFTVAAGAGLIVFAFGVTCLLSVRIRKIAPKALIAGE